MASIDYARVRAIFLSVCSLPPAERAAHLDRECSGQPELRREIESLLAHHQEESVFARPAARTAEPELALGHLARATSAKWEEEQRTFLQKRLRLWILVILVLIGLVLFRAFTYLDTWSSLAIFSRLGILGGCIGLVSLSGVTLALRSPSFAWLRRLDLALLGLAAIVVLSWSYSWFSNGVAVDELTSSRLDQLLAGGYWAITPKRVTLFRLGPAIVSFPVANYFSLIVCLYAIVIPNTGRRIVIIIAGMMLTLAATILLAAAANPVLRPHTASILLSSCSLMGVSSAIGAYVGLNVQALRRAVFDAKQVGQYKLTRLLGRGAMGEVYLGQHRLLRRPCAIKLIRAEQAGSEQALLRFEREVQAMAQLTHPNTVEIYDFGRTEDDSFFYAMEYLPGTTLDALVRSHGPLPPARAVYLLMQICNALLEAHMKGLIHRDIKPSNIFVCERGGLYDVIKLLDFGLVHVKDPGPPAAGDLLPSQPMEAGEGAPLPSVFPPGAGQAMTQTGQLLGTPAYMAPEQIEGKQPDARSDIYSLGGVACFLLSGRPPFERETSLELYAAHIDAPVPRLRDRVADLPADLESLIMRCLAKTPSARFQDVEELAAALLATTCSGQWSSTQAKAWWQAHAQPADAPDSDLGNPA
ncbi:MAG TPA: serine/threonine-protein kinase [Pseudomonadota bacterium]|nr:serine/threonine-protein kinase [Pseudomonadota bacterium]